MSVAVAVLEQADGVRRILDQDIGSALEEIEAGGVAHQQPAAVIEARKHRPLEQRRTGDTLDREAGRHRKRYHRLERLQLDLAKEHLGAFGLEQDFALGRIGPRRFQRDFAVDDIPDILAGRDQLKHVPFAMRFLQILRVAEPGRVLAFPPVFIAADLAADDALAIGRELGPGHETRPEAFVVIEAGASNQNEIAGPALDQLELD